MVDVHSCCGLSLAAAQGHVEAVAAMIEVRSTTSYSRTSLHF